VKAGLLKRALVYALLCIVVTTITAQQAVGIVSTVANLVSIVESRNATAVTQGQPIVEGAAYQASAASAAEFTFPEGLRAVAGPSSSLAFHPSPAEAGARLVSLSEGLYRFTFPDTGSRLDIATSAGAIRAVAAAPNSEILARVGPDGTVRVTVTHGKVELRDWASGTLLLLLLQGHSAGLGSGADGALAVSSSGPAKPSALAQADELSAVLAGKLTPSQAAPPATEPEASSGGGWNWTRIAIGVGAFIVVTVVAAVLSRHGGHGPGSNPPPID
jgi:hypothetical protein